MKILCPILKKNVSSILGKLNVPRLGKNNIPTLGKILYPKLAKLLDIVPKIPRYIVGSILGHFIVPMSLPNFGTFSQKRYIDPMKKNTLSQINVDSE